MIAFTKEEIGEIRLRAAKMPEVTEALEKKNTLLRKRAYIQETGIANWVHYFMCPKHTIRLKHDPDQPHRHVCPIDGEVFSGEPYDSAWWGLTTQGNAAGCYRFALLYLMTKDETAVAPAHRILLGYADKYPGYQPHGDIPYNKPGKALAQVLDDSGFLNNLARAYDILRDTFTEGERADIENRLLREGAKHLQKNLTPQLHNHEVAICSTLGIIGLILNDGELLRFALDDDFGLKYQLAHSVLSDGCWFEGSLGYHLYALRWFTFYEQFARHTPYSLMKDPAAREKLHQMTVYPLCQMDEEGNLPKLNDGSGDVRGNAWIFEYMYGAFRDEPTLAMLTEAVRDGRSTPDALLYGVFPLPEAPARKPADYCVTEGSRFAILHGEHGRYFLFKNAPYGGEHDHYDRLAIHFAAFGKPLMTDLGTASGYGAPLHYAYFKNTASHNTVCVDGANMPPADVKVNAYEKLPDGWRLDASVDFGAPYEMPNIFTICQWSEEAYAGVKMRRVIRWFGSYFVDVFTVESPAGGVKDFTYHIDAPFLTEPQTRPVCGKLRENGAQSHLTNVRETLTDEPLFFDGGDCELSVYTSGGRRLLAEGPANPSTHDLSYVILRSEESHVSFAAVVETAEKGKSKIGSVKFTPGTDGTDVLITEQDGTEKTVSVHGGTLC